jgi:5-methylcytosine-specific restriction endonuclease McrA
MRRIPQNKRDYYRNVYLRSEHWKNLRKEKKKLNPVCEVCGSKKKLDVHHINYRMLYDVLLEDLQTLCRRCHNKRHKVLDRFKKKSLRSKLRGLRRLIGG